MAFRVISIVCFVFIFVCCVKCQMPGRMRSGRNRARNATCIINGDVQGIIFLQQKRSSEGVSVTGQISGLSPGLHGFHVHEFGDLSNGCASTGGHYNPTNMDHGAPTDSQKHVGDLGNIEADRSGVADLNMVGDQMRLCGPMSIMGRAIVVHGGEDDLGRGGNQASRNNGNAGPRVGCCIIGVANNS
ncbi:superoxide dismutase [Cu-Zn]-like isoform X2 [Uloborus diversus]|uniref:superoxide dismutase [Cu-Zn]-like isoform X2 n=1 Tax=Uloborus diversus TaxID=327109 RepID=UPI00240A87A5|nr:superoxide dismutase [Cu-Zn]-like isoform X2 [Uloborus diversus]